MTFFETFNQTRQSVNNRFRFLVLCQLFIVWSVGRDAFTEEMYIEKYD